MIQNDLNRDIILERAKRLEALLRRLDRDATRLAFSRRVVSAELVELQRQISEYLSDSEQEINNPPNSPI